MIGYVGKFIPDLSSITKPFRQLIENEAEFLITEDHNIALKKIKSILTSNPILKRYDSSKETKLSADASKDGLGAVLLQKHENTWFPISYASRSLAKNEQKYAQIEKECLATVFACTRFHHYIYGKAFQCETDHKPLETLFKKNICDTPPRIQRMMMSLVKYPDMLLKFVPGTSLKIADTLSRAPLQTHDAPEVAELECQVHRITTSIPMSEQKLSEFKKATKDDPVLTKLVQVINEGWPKDYQRCPKELNDYWQHRDTLTVDQGLIFKGEKLVVPKAMRQLVKEKIHEGHLGIGKCTVRAKTYFFWPSMNKTIKDLVEKCPTCQEHRKAQPKQPNLSRDIDAPWHTVGCDIFHYEASHYLIVTDYFSSYPEVLLINKGPAHGTSKVMIEKMKSIFSRHGIPQMVVTDGGPQFTSYEFKEFSKSWEFEHEPSDPYFPRGNSKVERSVQTIKNLIRKAHASKTDVYASILAYRTSPLDCGKSPSQLLMNRVIRTRLNSHVQLPLRSEYSRQKYDQKYANMHTRTLPELHKGDNVRIWDSKKRKWSEKATIQQPYKNNPRSYEVETLDGKSFRRNRQHLLQTKERWRQNGNNIQHLDDDSDVDTDFHDHQEGESEAEHEDNSDTSSIISATMGELEEYSPTDVNTSENELDDEEDIEQYQPQNFNNADYRRFSERNIGIKNFYDRNCKSD